LLWFLIPVKCKIYILKSNKYYYVLFIIYHYKKWGRIISPYCTNCGSEVEDSWNACPNCGRILRATQVPQHQSIPQAQPQRQHAPQPYQVQPYQRSYSSSGGNTYGTIAIVLGIIGLFCGGIIFGFIAIVMGGLGLNRDDNNGMAIVGLVLGIIDFACCFLMYFWIFSWFSFFPFGGYW